MKIHLISDIHLEFGGLVYEPPECDVVILAGDIGIGLDGLTWAQETFSTPVIYVPGNHEYWGDTIWPLTDRLKEQAHGTNVHLLQHGSIEIDGVRFVGATTWTDFNLYGNSPLHETAADRAIKDFVHIKKKKNGDRFRATDAALEHAMAKQFIIDELSKPHDKTVVVTHHSPSELSVHPRYENDPINPAFASRLENIMLDFSPVLWAHGHTHDSFDYVIGDTRVVCNPRGYEGRQLNPAFDSRLVVEI